MKAVTCSLWFIDIARCLPALDACEHRRPRLPASFDPAASGERRAAHIALRLLMARHQPGRRCDRSEVVRGSSGRPEIAGANCAFSLSHADGFALIGLASPGTVIGVDLERADRAVRMLPERQGAIVAAASTLDRTSTPLAATRSGFLQAWTRLEALAKADGRGMAWLLAELGAWKKRDRPVPASETHERIDCLLHRLGVSVQDVAPSGVDIIIAAAAVPTGSGTISPRWLPDTPDALEALAAGD